jgi:signal transduction histidine kinase
VGWWDRRRLEDVCFHLLSNAIRFAGGAPVVIEVRTGPGEARLIVSDSGPGISPDEQELIFTGPDRPDPHPAGLGVGLWMVRHLVEAMGGAVFVESCPGQGATFTVRLPRRDG